MYTAQRNSELGTLNIIGCGRLGGSMAALWAAAGVMRIGCITNRTVVSTERAVSELGAGSACESIDQMSPAQIWMIATPDSQIEGAAERLARAGSVQSGDVVFHCSGALSSRSLGSLTGIGSRVASLHPVRSFARRGLTREDFRGTFCALEGDPQAIELLTQACLALDAKVFTIEANAKALCHAGHVFASNYVVAVAHVAQQLYRAAGLSDDIAQGLTEPLTRSALANMSALGTQAALTGPIVRGELAVVEEHLRAIGEVSPDALSLYTALGGVALRIAEQRGDLDKDQCARVAHALGFDPAE